MAKKKSGKMSKLKKYGKAGLASATIPLEYMGIDFMGDIGLTAAELIKAGIPLFEEGGQIKSKPKRKKPTKPLGRAPRLTLEGQYKAKPLGRAPNLKGKINKDAIKLLKQGGQAKSKSPRGCGKALRGYGKAMKKGK